VTGEVADRSPGPEILGVFAELFETEGAIGSRKDINAAIAFGDLVADQHKPGLLQS
jgi:hypothetical protein